MEGVKKKINFTEGRVFLKILLFVLPIVATNLLQAFYNAADMMVVSLSVEENAVGAIGTTTSFIHLIVNIFIGFSVGANVVVAREIGAKDRERTQKAVHTSLLMAAIFGLLGTAIGLIISRPVMRAMGNTGTLFSLAVTYTDIYFLGVPFLALTNYLIAIFRAKGDSKTPLIVLMAAGILNVGLNFFFVLVVGLSVEGVAIATAASNLASAVVLLLKLQKDKDDTQFSWKALKIDGRAFRDITVNGIPAGVQGALFSLSNMIIQSSIVQVNNTAFPPDSYAYAPIVNGNAAAMNLENFIFTAMNAAYQGAITFTSQNIGAKKPRRVRRILYSCLAIVTAIGMGLSALVYLLKEPLLALYGVYGDNALPLQWAAYNAAVTRFRYICLTYFLCGVMEVGSGVLRGLGRSLTAMSISLIGACLLRLVWIWTAFAANPTLDMIFISYPISWLLTATTAFVFIFFILRKLIRKADEEKAVE